jgi:putative ABC transport system permease protein
MVSAVSAEDTTRAQAEITAFLRDRHHVSSVEEDDFSVRNLTEIAAALKPSRRLDEPMPARRDRARRAPDG